VVPARKLTSGERHLVSRLLALGDCARQPYTDLDRIHVHGLCECGCGSFEMLPLDGSPIPRGKAKILADGYGTVQGGHPVGLILWGNDEQVTYCEIYALGFDPPYELPRPESLAEVPAESKRSV
jgi:hypothetical protein